MRLSAIVAAILVIAPPLAHGEREETVPIPKPETTPVWDESWAYPDVTSEAEFDESLEAADEDEDAGPSEPDARDALFSALSGVSPADKAKKTPGRIISIDEALAKSRRSGASWDFQLELGVTAATTFWDWDHFAIDDWSFISRPGFPLFFRARTGLLVLKEPWYFSLGPSVTYGGIDDWAIGAQVELTNIWGGVWAQAEMAYNISQQDLVASLAGGYQLMGVEIRAANGGRDLAVIAKVRAPVGLIVFVRGVLDRQKKK